MNSRAVFPDKPLIIAFLLLLIAALLVGNSTTALWDQDEAAYAGFARSMAVDGHWIVPKFPYSQAHRKVPLQFWLMAASYSVFGVNEIAARLPSVLAALGTAASVWFGGRFLVGRAQARLAAMMLASSVFVLTLGKIALTDATLLLFETIAALALLRGVVRPSWRATVVLWLAVAAGGLTKGPPIFILVGGMFLFLLIFHPRRRNLVHLHPWLGLPLAFVPLLVWGYFAWQQDPRYVLFLIYWYVLRRVGGSVFGQSGFPGVYFLMLFLCLVPWTGYLPPALVEAWRHLRRRRLRFVLLGSWLFGGWLLWELLPSKLPTYMLGAFPALALLMARQVYRSQAGALRWETHASLRLGFRVLVGVCFGLALVILALGVLSGQLVTQVLAIAPATAIAALGLIGLRAQRAGNPHAAVRTLLIGALIASILTWTIVVPGLNERRSTSQQVAAAIATHCTPETVVITGRRTSSPSLPFYVLQTGRRYTDIGERADERAPLVLDWSLVRQFKWKELVMQVQSQNLPERSDAADREFRLDRIRTLYQTGAPQAFILDDGQYAALRDELPNAHPIWLSGWSLEHLQPAADVLVVSPAAWRTP